MNELQSMRSRFGDNIHCGGCGEQAQAERIRDALPVARTIQDPRGLRVILFARKTDRSGSDAAGGGGQHSGRTRPT